MNHKRIEIRIKDYVADVRLNRPEKLNAIDLPMFDELIESGDALSNRRDVRAVVLSGAGRGFCAGLDLSVMNLFLSDDRRDIDALLGPPSDAASKADAANKAQRAVLTWRALPVPVIAAIHGVALGGGFQLALGADMRYASPESRFAIAEIKWGLVPDMGGLPLLSTLTRDDLIRELTFTGRELSAEEALSYGIITRLENTPYEAAHKTAQDIASKNPDAVRAAKKLINEAHLPFEQRLLNEAAAQCTLLGSENQREAIHAALEKRPALYK